MATTNQIGVCCDKHIFTNLYFVCGKYLTVRPDIGIVTNLNITILAIDDGISSDKNILSYVDPLIVIPFTIKDTIIIDDHVTLKPKLTWMPEYDIVTKNYTAPRRTK